MSEQDKITASSLTKNILSNKRFLIIVLFLLLLLSIFLKTRMLPALTGNIDVDITSDPDAAFYLRWLDVAIARFPHMPESMDYYSNYPWGIYLNTPPIWPYILAACSLLLTNVFRIDIHIAATMVALVVQALVIIPVYIIAREVFGNKAALLAAVCAATLPLFVIQGNNTLDHHSADVLLIPAIYASFLLSIRYASNREISRFSVMIAIGGVFIAIATLISLSLLMLISFLLVPVYLSFFILPRDRLKSILLATGGIFATATCILLLFLAVTPWFSSILAFERLSVLHIGLYAVYTFIAAAGFLLLRSKLKMETLKIIAGIFSILAGIAVFAVPQLQSVFLNGYYRSIGSYPLGLSTLELLPLTIIPKSMVISSFTYLIYTIPFVIAYLAYDHFNKRATDFGSLFIITTAIIYIFYVFNAFSYYSQYLAVYSSILYGAGLYLAIKFIAEKYSLINVQVEQVVILAAAVLLIYMTTCSFANFRSDKKNINAAELYSYINTSTDPPKDFNNPTEKPPYSIMCYWTDSYRIQYLGRRATVSSANSDVGMNGIITSARFFQSRSEEAAVEMLQGLNCRYVALYNMPNIYSGDLSRLGEPMPDPGRIVQTLIPNASSLDQEISNMMWARMLMDIVNSDSYKIRPSLQRFRLVFLGNSNSMILPAVLYEAVKGAKIVVQTKPLQEVTVYTNLTDNYGKLHRWQIRGSADKDGQFTVIAPYANIQNSTSIQVAPYEIETTSAKKRIDVSNDAVINGEAITVKM